MSERLLLIRGTTLGLLLLMSGIVWWSADAGISDTPVMTVQFYDVGQGDAIFIETPDGVQMLIDGGSDSSVLRALGESMSVRDRTIDVVLATHPDQDHIGGLVDVLSRYEVTTLFITENENDTDTSETFLESVRAEGAEVVYARRGQRILLGASTTVEVLSPAGPTNDWESNNASIIVQVRYGDVEFMLTGDAPSEIEEYLVEQYGEQLESEVLKLGHHGSKTSTSQLFLDVVMPEYAVVSAGADNRYGHPHPQVLGRAVGSGAEVVSTAESGTLTFITNGQSVWIDE